MNPSRLIGIARRAASRAPMEALDRILLTVEHGLEGDLRGRSGPRQVTVVSREDWEAACAQAGAALPWTRRRANLLVEHLPLADSAGCLLAVGDALLQVTGETRPCARMDEAAPGLRAAMAGDWRGGVTCRVLRGAVIRVGDAVARPAQDGRRELSA